MRPICGERLLTGRELNSEWGEGNGDYLHARLWQQCSWGAKWRKHLLDCAPKYSEPAVVLFILRVYNYLVRGSKKNLSLFFKAASVVEHVCKGYQVVTIGVAGKGTSFVDQSRPTPVIERISLRRAPDLWVFLNVAHVLEEEGVHHNLNRGVTGTLM